MLRPFLLIFDTIYGPRQDILNYLDTRPEIKNWYAFMPTAIIVISDCQAPQIAALFRQRFPGRQFMITEVPRGENDGWLNKNVWDFINNPQSTGRWL